MHVFTVHLHIRPECIETFKAITLANVKGSLQEPGCLRFDFLQHQEDPNRFIFFEAWKDDAAVAAHQASAHYLAWKAQVEELQAERRYPTRFDVVSFGREA